MMKAKTALCTVWCVAVTIRAAMNFYPWLKFFFECGAGDEGEDRNKNGIIDSIDDTLDLIAELKAKGYSNNSIKYLELASGKHDVPTWGQAFPEFLGNGDGGNSELMVLCGQYVAGYPFQLPATGNSNQFPARNTAL